MPGLKAETLNELPKGKHFDGRGVGLALDVRELKGKAGGEPVLRRYWIQRHRVEGKPKEERLGAYPEKSLREMRELATKNYGIGLEKNKRPQEPETTPGPEAPPKLEMPKAGSIFFMSFREYALHAFKYISPSYRSEVSQHQWLHSMNTYVFPHIGDMEIGEITANDLKRMFMVDDFWITKRETARKTYLRVRQIFEIAVITGRRPDNPALYLKRLLPKHNRKPKHFKALPWHEVPASVELIRNKGGWPPTRLALEFCILTAMRSKSVREARIWDINFVDQTWDIPAEYMKMNEEFSVPLSDRCMEILEEVEQYHPTSSLIFPNRSGTGPLSNMALLKILRDLEIPSTVHGYRSSLRDFCSEVLQSPFEVSEACLAHKMPPVVEAYARSRHLEAREYVMQKWADSITSYTSADIIPMTKWNRP